MIQQRKKCGKGGFTLVELVVTLVILSILFAIAVPSLLGYIHLSQFRKNESYAKTMISTIRRTADTNPFTSRQPGQPEVQPMNRLIRVLRDRRGESMVEILVSTVVFMLLLGALNGAVGFASNAQRKSEQLRRDATELQESVRGNAEVADGEAAAYDFKVTTSNGEDTDIDAFHVKVKKQTVNAKTEDGKTVPFYRFAKGE